MNFPGTITWRHDTFMACLEDTILALSRHGIQRFLILNGHGGNRAAISVLATQLRYEEDLMVAGCTWFELVREACQKFIPKRRVHADEIEAAMGLYLAPRVVRKADLAKGKAHADPYPYTDPGTGGGIEVPYRWEELTPNGAYGDARRATTEMGKELTAVFLEKAGDFVEAFMVDKTRGAGKKGSAKRP
jgi:creatinine amidohydrolase